MTQLEDILKSRRDTRHFTTDEVPESVIQKALQAGHLAPSVGLTDATRYYIIKSVEIKKAIKALFITSNKKAAKLTDNATQKLAYEKLKLEAIIEAPIGLVIGYDRSVLNNFTIGTIGSNEAIKMSAVCAAQNIWLSLTEQEYSMGWVSIINYHHFKQIIGLPENIEPIGYFCIGKPATSYNNQPMLQQLGWKEKRTTPIVSVINKIHEINNPKTTKVKISKKNIANQIQNKINNKAKPIGSLGMLETIASQIAHTFNTLNPKIKKPHIVIFAADHGIAHHNISAYPQDVTRQMVTTFLKGKAAINIFCKQNKISLSIVDAGVNYDFPTNSLLINNKIDKGTQSFLYKPAMTMSQYHLCFQKGKEVVNSIAANGGNCIGFGEMGIGNTATASVLMAVLTNIPIEECVGKGTGISDAKYQHKISILKAAIQNYSGLNEIEEKIAYYGGFEILQMAGGMLQAYQHNMIILVDGFISSVAFLIAYIQNPNIKLNAIFCHTSNEKAHAMLLQYLGVTSILQLSLRLGEGTGCAIAFPIIKSAEIFLNKMTTFNNASVAENI